MPVSAPKQAPIVLKWHARSGALWDPDLNLHSGTELLDWFNRGVDFVVLDAETGDDVTRLFLAHWDDGQLVDPLAPAR
jgi:hypothetical protein